MKLLVRNLLPVKFAKRLVKPW